MRPTTEQIWHRLGARVRSLVRSRIRRPADADDVVQAIFLRVHEKLESVHDTERLDGWVFRITHNAIRDYYRSRPVRTTDTVGRQPGPVSDEANQNRRIADCLPGLIQELPGDQQRAIRMYEFEGMSQLDIAACESISLSGAKSRVQRGRQRLEMLLRNCCHFELDRRGNVLNVEPREGSCRLSDPCRGACC